MIPKIELTLGSGKLVTFLVPAIAVVTAWEESGTRTSIETVGGRRWEVREEYTEVLDFIYEAEARKSRGT
jgi:pyruvate-formate lyase-activating enzyme